ncbi:MAG: hypothetical protein C0617_01755 [Desulfuromonas sp.]|uniref:rhomboid family intramembrane serine protease n=1 Tax=Desulfuromonas sp. TaxID=892 RepID=UPI000CB91C57|nr:rhomboid family intramembrane serine protease [Desulfuromonas sp.]PLX86326.1 MAG: hypothetical protein C0617_01755 [Desulfuromonas sp.]
MFLPIGDTPNPRGTPIVNYLLIGANVAVFLLLSLPLTASQPDLNDPLLLDYLRALGARGAFSAETLLEQVSAYDLFVFRFGYRPAESSLLTLFSSIFLHGGWMHLAGNMLFLWIFGDNVEHRMGRLGYLLAYLGCGVAATLFFALFVPGSQIPLVGASGAISGVLGLYFLWFPRNRVKTFVFLFPFIMTTFSIPARFVLGFYLVVDNLLPFLASGGGAMSGVAHGAHIGGFLGGLGLAYGMDRLPGRSGQVRSPRLRVVKRAPRPAPPPETGEVGLPRRIAERLRSGDRAGAAALYLELGGREGRSRVGSGDLLAIGDFLLASGEYDLALSLFRRYAAERQADPAVDRAYLGAGKALMHKPRCVTSSYQYFLSALDAARTREVAEEARMHLRAIERLGETD